MISIEEAIEQAKNMKNISNGGSACFDFGEVVLVKYTCPVEYLPKDVFHIRENEEVIMKTIDEKRDAGVQIPRHFAMKRVIEGKLDVCYVLQEKAKGTNCEEMSKENYGLLPKRYESLYYVLRIPFEQYRKLVRDGCQLYEMGYEPKNKNLFYDSETGFWFIDFLENDSKNPFDSKDIRKVFFALSAVVPNPIQMATRIPYDMELKEVEKRKDKLLQNSIRAKMLLAMKAELPILERYEKFFLLGESDLYKNYLMKEKVVQKNLLVLEVEDYEIYDELYQLVLEGLVQKIVEQGEPYWSIECNDIRNDAELFHLQKFWESHVENPLTREEYKSDLQYKLACDDLFTERMLEKIIEELKGLEPNPNIMKFLEEVEKRRTSNTSQK